MRAARRLLAFLRDHPIAGRAPRKALWRVLRWQVFSRATGRAMVVPYVAPTRITLRRGLSSATASFYVGLIDPAEMGFLLHLLRPGDLFVDVGANIGAYTVLASGVCGARSIAAEPAAATRPHLRENLALNGIEALVTIVEAALGDAPGTARFSAGRGATNRLAADGDTQVAVTTLDAVCVAEAPLLLKLDVEGHELSVLRGGAAILGDPSLRAAIIETNGHGDDTAVHALMTAAGFWAADYDAVSRTLAPRAGTGFPNTLYVRDAGWLAERLAGGAPHQVLGHWF